MVCMAGVVREMGGGTQGVVTHGRLARGVVCRVRLRVFFFSYVWRIMDGEFASVWFLLVRLSLSFVCLFFPLYWRKGG